MEQSKPGTKLSPQLKAVVEPIYRRDPKRYQRLCQFVWTMQKQGWPDEAIAHCLKLADPHLDHLTSWWAYLVKRMPLGKARASEQESDKHKCEVGQLAQEFVNFLKARHDAQRNDANEKS